MILTWRCDVDLKQIKAKRHEQIKEDQEQASGAYFWYVTERVNESDAEMRCGSEAADMGG